MVTDEVDIARLFDEVIDFPDPDAFERYQQLVGLETVQERLLKQAQILIHPGLLDNWAQNHHRGPIGLLAALRTRPPLFIFGGDVGTGKSSLAESFGDPVARQLRIPIKLMSLSLSARGSGTVGEMTTLITQAFAAVEALAPAGTDPDRAVILLIDEADALAQSRESDHMHHEDRAGVNALIRGIDKLARDKRAVITVLCTNRLGALDPAIRRRAFDEFTFERPGQAQRETVLAALLQGAGFSAEQIGQLAAAAGENNRSHGLTYSDITHRLASTLLLDAFPEQPVRFDRALEITAAAVPTRPFDEGRS